jgi:hypothetical protein
MAAPRHLRTSHVARRTLRLRSGQASHAVAALAGLVLALLPAVAAAQEAESTSDRDRVMWWTVLTAIGALLLAAVGYAYRRMRGMDHPTPDELEMMGGHHGGHDQSAAEHGAHEAVPPHAEAEHGAPAH